MKKLILITEILLSTSLWADSDVTPIPDLICEVQVTIDELYGMEGRSETENERYSSTSEFKNYPDNPLFQMSYIGEVLQIYRRDDCKLNEELMVCELNTFEDEYTEYGVKNERHSLTLNRLSGIIDASTYTEYRDGPNKGWFDQTRTTEKGSCKVMPKEKKF